MHSEACSSSYDSASSVARALVQIAARTASSIDASLAAAKTEIGGAALQDIMSRFHGTWAVKPESDDTASPRCSAVLDQEVLPKGEEGRAEAAAPVGCLQVMRFNFIYSTSSWPSVLPAPQQEKAGARGWPPYAAAQEPCCRASTWTTLHRVVMLALCVCLVVVHFHRPAASFRRHAPVSLSPGAEQCDACNQSCVQQQLRQAYRSMVDLPLRAMQSPGRLFGRVGDQSAPGSRH